MRKFQFRGKRVEFPSHSRLLVELLTVYDFPGTLLMAMIVLLDAAGSQTRSNLLLHLHPPPLPLYTVIISFSLPPSSPCVCALLARLRFCLQGRSSPSSRPRGSHVTQRFILLQRSHTVHELISNAAPPVVSLFTSPVLVCKPTVEVP